MDEAEQALHDTADENLLRVYAALTHRLHAADRAKGPVSALLALDIRIQRDQVQQEILRRMRSE